MKQSDFRIPVLFGVSLEHSPEHLELVVFDFSLCPSSNALSVQQVPDVELELAWFSRPARTHERTWATPNVRRIFLQKCSKRVLCDGLGCSPGFYHVSFHNTNIQQ